MIDDIRAKFETWSSAHNTLGNDTVFKVYKAGHESRDAEVASLLAARSESAAEIERLRAERDVLQTENDLDQHRKIKLQSELDAANARLQEERARADRLQEAILPCHSRCRDYSDENGRCPHTRYLCDPQATAIEVVNNWKLKLVALTARVNELEGK